MARSLCRLLNFTKCTTNTVRLAFAQRNVRFMSSSSKGPNERKLFTWRSLGVVSVSAAVMYGALRYIQKEKDAAIEKERKRSIGKAAIGGSWELVDTKGNKRTSEEFKGRWCLVYFGFTHCPDVCPDELEKMAGVVDDLEKEKIDIQPLFITVDPERDSKDILENYTKEFSPKLLGLTGTIEQISSVCKKFRVYFSAGPKDKDNDYIVDHTIILYLINPNGEFVDYYGQNSKQRDVTNAILLSVASYNQAHKKSMW